MSKPPVGRSYRFWEMRARRWAKVRQLKEIKYWKQTQVENQTSVNLWFLIKRSRRLAKVRQLKEIKYWKQTQVENQRLEKVLELRKIKNAKSDEIFTRWASLVPVILIWWIGGYKCGESLPRVWKGWDGYCHAGWWAGTKAFLELTHYYPAFIWSVIIYFITYGLFHIGGGKEPWER